MEHGQTTQELKPTVAMLGMMAAWKKKSGRYPLT